MKQYRIIQRITIEGPDGVANVSLKDWHSVCQLLESAKGRTFFILPIVQSVRAILNLQLKEAGILVKAAAEEMGVTLVNREVKND